MERDKENDRYFDRSLFAQERDETLPEYEKMFLNQFGKVAWVIALTEWVSWKIATRKKKRRNTLSYLEYF
jgi:hypothetical protein